MCSSDLDGGRGRGRDDDHRDHGDGHHHGGDGDVRDGRPCQIGKASCRERV